jgi:2'-5' RNA ligase
MRVFLALPLPEAIARALSAAAHAALGPQLDLLRLVPTANLHLTLHFLGETSPAVLQRLPSELDARLAGLWPVDVSITGTGAFPDSPKKHVLWAGVRGEALQLARLAELRARCQQAVAASGHALPDPAEPFAPHVTLARSRAGLRAPRAWRELDCAFDWRVERVELLQSLQAEGRTRYPVLGAWTLVRAD